MFDVVCNLCDETPVAFCRNGMERLYKQSKNVPDPWIWISDILKKPLSIFLLRCCVTGEVYATAVVKCEMMLLLMLSSLAWNEVSGIVGGQEVSEGGCSHRRCLVELFAGCSM